MNIDKSYTEAFSPELFKEDWNFQEHEHCFTAHNFYEDIKIVIPKNLDEVNMINIWCCSDLVGEFETVSKLDTLIKEILGETK